MAGQYAQVHEERKKAGTAKAPTKSTGTITFEGPNIIDESDPTKPPKIPPAPRSPIPLDDAFHKMRSEKA